ncbi:MAG: hypothetical protein V4603_11000, partial [Pseudomonadota bacterium]
MTLRKSFSHEQLIRILDQALIYQCTCPAQVCRTLIGLNELYDYQLTCLNRTETDRAVHAAIAASVARTHAEMESCLDTILTLEG